jgi:hypothetical protein
MTRFPPYDVRSNSNRHDLFLSPFMWVFRSPLALKMKQSHLRLAEDVVLLSQWWIHHDWGIHCFFLAGGVLKQIQVFMKIVSKTIKKHPHLHGFYHPLDWFTIAGGLIFCFTSINRDKTTLPQLALDYHHN